MLYKINPKTDYLRILKEAILKLMKDTYVKSKIVLKIHMNEAYIR